jgi:hypothetical protein
MKCTRRLLCSKEFVNEEFHWTKNATQSEVMLFFLSSFGNLNLFRFSSFGLRLLPLALSPFFLGGCQSASPTAYVAPRITGRVLDVQSQQPLAQVTVRRLGDDQNRSRMEPRHGGQTLQQPPAFRTSVDGAFVLESARALTPFRTTGWYVVYVAFELEGYESKVIHYTLANATNNFKGEPVINAGDIKLARSKP